jgi:hypothetical protein
MPQDCPHRALGSNLVALHSLSRADESSIQVLCPWYPLLLSNDAPGCNSAVKGLPGFRTARLSRNQDQGGTRMRGYGQTPTISASPVAALLPGDSRRFSDGWGDPNSCCRDRCSVGSEPIRGWARPHGYPNAVNESPEFTDCRAREVERMGLCFSQSIHLGITHS